MKNTEFFHSLFYNSTKSISQILIEEAISEETLNKNWNEFSDVEKKYRKMLIKKHITLETVIQWFHSDLSAAKLGEKYKIKEGVFNKIWAFHFSKDDLKNRISRMNSLSRIGDKNPMSGKSGEQSPVFGRKITQEEFEKRSKALKGKLKGRVSPRKGAVLSDETKAKIRKATQQQYLEGRVKTKDTIPELKVKEILVSLECNPAIQYIPLDEIPSWPYGPLDFALPDKKIAIEVLGDFWHGNPEHYPELSDRQKRQKHKDIHRRRILQNNDWFLLEIWEDDIVKNIEKVKLQIIQFLSNNESVINVKVESSIVREIETDKELLNKIKESLIHTKSFTKSSIELGIHRRILSHINKNHNFIKIEIKPLEIYTCFLCDFSGVQSTVVEHYNDKHIEIVDKLIEEYDLYNLSVAQKKYPINPQVVNALIEKYGKKKSHSEAMSVRAKPSVSNFESGAGVKKGQATQYATNHFNPELAEHERKRQELGMTKEDYMKHIGVDNQFLRRLTRGFESRKMKPTVFNTEHKNPEYAEHERKRQMLNMTQDEYQEYIGEDKNFLRRLKNCNLEQNEIRNKKQEEQSERFEKKNFEKTEWKEIENEIVSLFDSNKSARTIGVELGASKNTVMRTWERNFSEEEVKKRHSVRRIEPLSFDEKKEKHIENLKEKMGYKKLNDLVESFKEDLPISKIEDAFCETRKVITKLWGYFYSSDDIANRGKRMQNKYKNL